VRGVWHHSQLRDGSLLHDDVFPNALVPSGLELENVTASNFLSLPGSLWLKLFILFLGQNNGFSHYQFYCFPKTF
jgi:hypothetical protein